MKLLLTGLLLLAMLPAEAQDAKVSREREMLRRSQAALKEAQARGDALTAEKAALAQRQEALKAEAERSLQALRSAQAERVRQQASAGRLTAELSAERARAGELQQRVAALTAQAEQAARDAEALQKQLAEARREAAGRSQTNATLTALLERATSALGEAEARNRQLHAAGLRAVEQLRGRTRADELAQQDPIFGLRAVELENVAEGLRSELDKHRVLRQ